MKIALIYSSLTGNTEKIAKAILSVLPANTDCIKLCGIKKPDLKNYDLLILGTWIDKGTADPFILELAKDIKDKKIVFFFTLGAYPDSKHADDCTMNLTELFTKNGNLVLGNYHCQGAVDPKLIEKFKRLPADHPHALTDERLKRYEEAAKHPDEKDMNKAKQFIKNLNVV
ncbi:MAG: flavodoxin [Candidatus Delongbacteria bacterium]|nr:flavodoxin [Candidatus Delongbacteria bacterium]MBN2833484.1 flavodoxin [Candidatus Delongbacteria bacterium]